MLVLSLHFNHNLYYLLDPKQHQATYCLIEHSSDATYVLKALKQKLYVDNLAYLLQDIYGIENKLVHTRVLHNFVYYHLEFSRLTRMNH